MGMIWNSASVESILATIAAALFAVAGVVNLARLGAVKRDFARWGYPVWFPFLCGALELISAALILRQQTRLVGLMLAGAIMVGALVTLLRNREPFAHVAPALVFFVLIVITGAARLL
jgi:phosphatidylserine synthase